MWKFSCPSLISLIALSLLTISCSQPSAQTADGAGGGRGGRSGFGGGAQPVAVAKVSQKDVPVDIDAVGNVEASTTIAVRTQVTGTLELVGFHEGDFVKKGSLLFSIDRRPLEAVVQQAEANLVRDWPSSLPIRRLVAAGCLVIPRIALRCN